MSKYLEQKEIPENDEETNKWEEEKKQQHEEDDEESIKWEKEKEETDND